MSNLTVNITLEDLCENEKKEDKNYDKNSKNDAMSPHHFNSNHDDYTEIMRSELESELEKQNYSRLYKIVDENTKANMVCFELDSLNRLIYEEFSGRYDNAKIDSFINRVPDLFAVILRDRVDDLIENKQ